MLIYLWPAVPLALKKNYATHTYDVSTFINDQFLPAALPYVLSDFFFWLGSLESYHRGVQLKSKLGYQMQNVFLNPS